MPLVAHEEKCVACRLCELMCPDLAITVTKLEEDEAGTVQTDPHEPEVKG